MRGDHSNLEKFLNNVFKNNLLRKIKMLVLTQNQILGYSEAYVIYKF